MTDTLTLQTNYTKVINYCIEIFKPNNEFIIVIILSPNIVKISSLIKKESHFKVTYIYETNEKIDERIFYNFENFAAFLLAERNNDKSLISENLLKRLKIHEFDSFENATCSTTKHTIKFRKNHGNISNQKPPLFEYFIRDVCDFEAILYYILNTIKVFMGEVIEIVFADKTEVKSYTFRRGLFNFVFKRKMKRRNFHADILPLQNNKHVIILKDTPISKINEKYTVIKMSLENIKKGLEYYEKAEEEQALAISGTSDYIEILEELQEDKAVIKETKKNMNLPVISIPKINPSDKNKKVFIEIKNSAFRICVTEKKEKKNNLIFAYPDDNEFIPMYISFLRKTVIIGKQAIKDYKTHPKSVVFDIINVLGKLKHNPPEINPKWGFQLLPISASHDAKLGFKIHTFNGVKLFPVEIIFAILFKYLLNIASKHLHIKSIDLRFLQIKLTPLQRICLKDVGKLLNISVNVESHL